jgi:hypothetical protein
LTRIHVRSPQIDDRPDATLRLFGGYDGSIHDLAFLGFRRRGPGVS